MSIEFPNEDAHQNNIDSEDTHDQISIEQLTKHIEGSFGALGFEYKEESNRVSLKARWFTWPYLVGLFVMTPCFLLFGLSGLGSSSVLEWLSGVVFVLASMIMCYGSIVMIINSTKIKINLNMETFAIIYGPLPSLCRSVTLPFYQIKGVYFDKIYSPSNDSQDLKLYLREINGDTHEIIESCKSEYAAMYFMYKIAKCSDITCWVPIMKRSQTEESL